MYNDGHCALSIFNFPFRTVKQRVVVLSAFLSPLRSGAEACAEEVAVRLAASYDVVIITARMRLRLPRQDDLLGVSVVRVGLGLPIDKWLFPLLSAWTARRLRPALLHAVLESYAGVALLCARMLVPDARRLLTLQSTNTSFLLGPIHRAPHRLTAISQVLIDRAASLGRTDVTLIPNGIPLDATREVCGQWDKVPERVLFVGRLEPMKGVDVLLRTFAIVSGQWSAVSGQRERRAVSGGRKQGAAKLTATRSSLIAPHLHIVGDGSLRKQLQQLARELGVDRHVTFRGYLTGLDLLREFAEAEVFCGLSRSEAFGNVFLEAQAAGCAVVATTVQGIPEIVPKAAGTLVAPDDPAAAAEAIQVYLQNPKLREQAAEAGRQHAQHYDWSAIAARYGQVYAEMLVA